MPRSPFEGNRLDANPGADESTGDCGNCIGVATGTNDIFDPRKVVVHVSKKSEDGYRHGMGNEPAHTMTRPKALGKFLYGQPLSQGLGRLLQVPFEGLLRSNDTSR